MLLVGTAQKECCPAKNRLTGDVIILLKTGRDVSVVRRDLSQGSNGWRPGAEEFKRTQKIDLLFRGDNCDTTTGAGECLWLAVSGR